VIMAQGKREQQDKHLFSKTALYHFSKAVELDPNNYEFHVNYANQLYLSGDLHSALRHFKQAFQLKPLSHLHRNIVSILQQLENPETHKDSSNDTGR